MAKCTVCVLNLPYDFSERELSCLFTFARGFQDAAFRTHPNGQKAAFARFDQPANALGALDVLNGRVIDRLSGIALSATIAPQELPAKRKHDFAPEDDYPAPRRSFPSPSQAPPNDLDNPPSATLFVGMIPAGVDEPQLRPLFETCPGYLGFRMKGVPGRRCGFVDFDSIPHCTAAMKQFQGYTFPECGNGSLHLSYARAPNAAISPIQPTRNFQPQPPIQTIHDDRHNPPSTELFVGMLPETAGEADLRDLFQSLPGFVEMRMKGIARKRHAFITFDSIENSANAMQQYEGFVFPGTETGINLVYARHGAYRGPQ